MDRDQGRTLTGVRGHALSLRRLRGDAVEIADVQRVLAAAPAYYATVLGRPSEATEANALFAALPPGRTQRDKFVWGLYADEMLIGCADVVLGYPVADTAIIGLLLLAESWQGRGFGRAFAQMIEDATKQLGGSIRLRLGVALANPRAPAFWRRLGFVATGEVRFAEPGHVRVAVLEKPLTGVSTDE